MKQGALRKYLITAPQHYPSDSFESCLQSRLSLHRPYAALFRGYEADECYCSKAQIFVKMCADYNCLSFVSADIALAYQLSFDGVHLKGHQLSAIDQILQSPNESQKPLIFYSAHSLNDMIEADQKGVDAMTISPIFKTPNKGQPLGISFLTSIQYPFKAQVFALGGIVGKDELDQLQYVKCLSGFASIRFFV